MRQEILEKKLEELSVRKQGIFRSRESVEATGDPTLLIGLPGAGAETIEALQREFLYNRIERNGVSFLTLDKDIDQAALHGILQNKLREMDEANRLADHYVQILVISGFGDSFAEHYLVELGYQVRSILEEMQVKEVGVTAFLFTPDLPLASPAYESKSGLKAHMQASSYAALRKLDYYMDAEDTRDAYISDWVSDRVSGKNVFDVCNMISPLTADGILNRFQTIQKLADLLFFVLTEDREKAKFPVWPEVFGRNYKRALFSALPTWETRSELQNPTSVYGYQLMTLTEGRIPTEELLGFLVGSLYAAVYKQRMERTRDEREKHLLTKLYNVFKMDAIYAKSEQMHLAENRFGKDLINLYDGSEEAGRLRKFLQTAMTRENVGIVDRAVTEMLEQMARLEDEDALIDQIRISFCQAVMEILGQDPAEKMMGVVPIPNDFTAKKLKDIWVQDEKLKAQIISHIQDLVQDLTLNLDQEADAVLNPVLKARCLTNRHYCFGSEAEPDISGRLSMKATSNHSDSRLHDVRTEGRFACLQVGQLLSLCMLPEFPKWEEAYYRENGESEPLDYLHRLPSPLNVDARKARGLDYKNSEEYRILLQVRDNLDQAMEYGFVRVVDLNAEDTLLDQEKEDDANGEEHAGSEDYEGCEEFEDYEDYEDYEEYDDSYEDGWDEEDPLEAYRLYSLPDTLSLTAFEESLRRLVADDEARGKMRNLEAYMKTFLKQEDALLLCSLDHCMEDASGATLDRPVPLYDIYKIVRHNLRYLRILDRNLTFWKKGEEILEALGKSVK